MIGWFAAGRFEAVNRRWRRVHLRDWVFGAPP
jgi:hypothetical protein